MSKELLQGTKDLYAMLTDEEKRNLVRFVCREREQKRERLREIFSTGENDSTFDFDILDGVESESELYYLFRDGGKLEVKRDFKVSTTGNVAIEFECYGKPSGISITKADYWALQLDGSQFWKEIIVVIKTERLKKLAETYPIDNGGDYKAAKFYLVPVKELLSRKVDIFTRRAERELKY